MNYTLKEHCLPIHLSVSSVCVWYFFSLSHKLSFSLLVSLCARPQTVWIIALAVWKITLRSNFNLHEWCIYFTVSHNSIRNYSCFLKEQLEHAQSEKVIQILNSHTLTSLMSTINLNMAVSFSHFFWIASVFLVQHIAKKSTMASLTPGKCMYW